ncbi:MAG TPA: phosphotriesterase-related protein [Bryobacteraceae bacterium]|nr:phosphotriesterase-related protein [Bryobacteraceae bacterium]
MITTVLGEIAPSEAGVTLSHEHLLCDLWQMFPSYDNILDDEKLAVSELERYKAAGGGTVVDCTSIGLRRNPEALRRISRAAGVHIVMGTGWYREKVYPAYVQESLPDELAEFMVGELERGADGTKARAGMIGEIGTERYHITPAQERVFRAAARAQQRTGVAIWTHTTHFGELALEQIALLREEGVPHSRIVISHLGDRRDFSALDKIACTGVYLSIDNIGYEGEGYPDDGVRAENVLKLMAGGHLEQIMLSLDVCAKSHLAAYGGKGYAHVQEKFLPRLRAAGVTEQQIAQMTVANPRRALDRAAAQTKSAS